MDTVLIILGLVLSLAGILGSILPVLPALPLSWTALLLLQLTDVVPINYTMLGISLGVTVLIFVLSYIIPALGTKRFGGSRKGAIGTSIGLVVGIVAPIPLGILIGPFIGAFLGEFLFQRVNSTKALRAAFGSFIGFLASSFIEFFAACVFTGLWVYQFWQYRHAFF